MRRQENNLVPSLQSSSFKRRLLPPTNIEFKRYEKYRLMHVDEDYHGNLLPIHLFDTIKPLVRNKFLIHVLISMGSFNTELELYRGNAVKQWFCNAGLVRCAHDISEEEVNDIIRIYYLTQLLCVPSGTRTLDRYVCASYHYLTDSLMGDGTMIFETPPVLATALNKAATVEISQEVEGRKPKLIECLLQDGGVDTGLCMDELMRATLKDHLPFRVKIVKRNVQPEESFQEQTRVMEKMHKAIGDYTTPDCRHPKCVVIAGEPGTGKPI